jgi:hypothetical protein
MQTNPYFTRDEVTLWFAEYDQGLEPLNARRAADKLLADLRAAGTIVLLSMNRGWSWRGAPDAPSDHKAAACQDAPPKAGEYA